MCEHLFAVAHIGIREGKRTPRKHLKEFLFRSEVVFKALVIVEVVVGDIGEDPTGKSYPHHAVLVECMRRHLHKDVRTACRPHISQGPIQGDRVGSRVARRYHLAGNDIFYGRDKTCLIAECGGNAVQQGCGRGLAVGPGYSDDREPSRRGAVPGERYQGKEVVIERLESSKEPFRHVFLYLFQEDIHA